MTSPLFRNTIGALQAAAREEFRRSAVGQMLGTVERLRYSRRPSSRDLRTLSQQMRRLGRPEDLRRQFANTAIGRALGEVNKYARSGWGAVGGRLFDVLMQQLGPVGGVIKALLRPAGNALGGGSLDRELETAAQFLEAFGYKVDKPKSAAEATGRARTRADEIEEAQRLLERAGFTQTPPLQDRTQPPQTKPGPPGTVRVKVDNQSYNVPEQDPLLTGEMIPVKSSNVHSIGFLWNEAQPTQGTLKVRFLDKRGKSSRAGATYYYYGVHPELFVRFQRAQSKGRWVWDNLRIRGTVSGHRYRYQLAGLGADGYVPRQARRLGNEEWYIRRRVLDKQGRSYRSQLDDEFVKMWEQKSLRRRPKNGGPNRGRPNRGR